MKFNVDSLLLGTVGKTVAKGYVPKADNSKILLNIIENNGSYSLEVLSVSNKSYFKGLIPIRNVEIEDGEETSWEVEGQSFKVILDLLPTISLDVKFSITPSTGKIFQIKYTGRVLKLNVLNSEVNIPEYEVKNITEVSAVEFMQTSKNASRLVDSSPQKQGNPLSTVHFTFEEDELVVMGTNQATLAEMKIKSDGLSKEDVGKVILINASQLSLLDGSFNSTDSLKLVETDDKFGYIDNEILQLVSKTNLTPLPYKPVLAIPADEQEVIVNTSSFKEAVTALTKLSFDVKSVVVFSLEFKQGRLIAGNLMGNEIEVKVEDNSVEDVILYFTKDNLNRLTPLLTDKFVIGWQKDRASNPHAKFSNLDKEGNKTESVSMFISTYLVENV